MPHMIPQYSHEDFVIVHKPNGDDEAIPADVCIPADYPEDTELEPITDKWFYRLSAPGYLDCTDWTGPFDTIEEAKSDLVECYDVHPETGETLPECAPPSKR